MPKEGYYSLTIKQEAADVFQRVAKEENKGIVEYFNELALDIGKIRIIKTIQEETMIEALGQAHFALAHFRDYYVILTEKKSFLGQDFVNFEFLQNSIFEIHAKQRFVEMRLNFTNLVHKSDCEKTKLARILGDVKPEFQIAPLIRPPFQTPIVDMAASIPSKKDIARFINNSELIFGARFSYLLDIIEMLEKIRPTCEQVAETISLLQDLYTFLEGLKNYLINTLCIAPEYLLTKE
jgi:hypothetical protein